MARVRNKSIVEVLLKNFVLKKHRKTVSREDEQTKVCDTLRVSMSSTDRTSRTHVSSGWSSDSSSEVGFHFGPFGARKSIIHDLMEKQDWKRLHKILGTTKGRTQALSEGNVLHWACRFHAPLNVIKALCEAQSELVSTLDHRGRTPLHVAAAAWNAPDIIKYLVSLDPSTASSKDRDLRTPLHLACFSADASHGGRKLSENLRRPTECTVYILCKAAPKTVNEDDFQECTPIELAIECKLPLKAVQLMRKTSEAEWKRAAAERRNNDEAASSHDNIPCTNVDVKKKGEEDTQQLRRDLVRMDLEQKKLPSYARSA